MNWSTDETGIIHLEPLHEYLLLEVERLDAQLFDELVEARDFQALDLELFDKELVLALKCDVVAVLL